MKTCSAFSNESSCVVLFLSLCMKKASRSIKNSFRKHRIRVDDEEKAKTISRCFVFINRMNLHAEKENTDWSSTWWKKRNVCFLFKCSTEWIREKKKKIYSPSTFERDESMPFWIKFLSFQIKQKSFFKHFDICKSKKRKKRTFRFYRDLLPSITFCHFNKMPKEKNDV